MRRRHYLIIALAVLLAVAAVGVVLWRLRKAPPRAVRLLPEVEDAVLYINLKPLRTAGVIGNKPGGPREREYEEFVRETGFEFERDLDQAAFAMHAPTAESRGEARYSEILIGRFDSEKLAAYLRKLASPVSSEHHREVEIIVIPHEGRRVRVAILGVDTVAVSNQESGQAIREMIDHYKAAAAPRGGPALVRGYYREVPFGALGWAITRVAPTQAPSLGGFDISGMLRNLMAGSVVVGSVRYLPGEVQFRAEAISQEENARRVAENLTTWLSIYRSVEESVQPKGGDPDVKQLLDSISVEQKEERVVVRATLPQGFLYKLFSEAPKEEPTAPTAPGTGPQKQKR